MGYARAGFEVVGVDIKPQPHYPFEFHQADAMTYPLDGFDVIHASPPCQLYSVANNVWKRDHPDLLPPTQQRLYASGIPYVIENVPGAPIRNPFVVCGLALGVNVKRHRLFESDHLILVPPCPKGHPGDWLLVFGHTVLERGHVVRQTPAGGNTTHRKHTTTERGREAMGIDWMNRDELSEAIPPAYTELIGSQLLNALRLAA
jgi:DNA (cytosine-5)-methyltransferase 1